ncbi:hypothetical protein KUL42_35480 [Alteromonas sp. KUL42]|nr:hypothetical protein KUL42_35480 [Alteromonas sp. KUL42]
MFFSQIVNVYSKLNLSAHNRKERDIENYNLRMEVKPLCLKLVQFSKLAVDLNVIVKKFSN